MNSAFQVAQDRMNTREVDEDLVSLVVLAALNRESARQLFEETCRRMGMSPDSVMGPHREENAAR